MPRRKAPEEPVTPAPEPATEEQPAADPIEEQAAEQPVEPTLVHDPDFEGEHTEGTDCPCYPVEITSADVAPDPGDGDDPDADPEPEPAPAGVPIEALMPVLADAEPIDFLADGEEVLAERLDEASGFYIVATNFGRKFSLEGDKAVLLCGPATA